MNAHILDQVYRLSLDEQLELIDALWNNIAQRNAEPLPTDAQIAELERRLADNEANPNNTVPWHEVKAAVLARIEL